MRLFGLFFAFILITSNVCAQISPAPTPLTRQGSVTFINHFGANLNFVINQADSNTYAPNFPLVFDLAPGEEKSSAILPADEDCKSTIPTSTYFLASEKANLDPALGRNIMMPKAYFAVGLRCNSTEVQVSGFMSINLAYSWQNGTKATIIFCEPQDYPCR